MKIFFDKKRYKSMSVNKTTLSIFLFSIFLMPVLARGAVRDSDWQKGGSINPASPTDFQSDLFKQSVKNLKAVHANYVTLIIPWYQNNIKSTQMHPGPYTPTDESLIEAIKYSHSLGLKVNLKPHQFVLTPNTEVWRADINPVDRAGWFGNYKAMLEHYTKIAQQHGVEQITIGTELINMTSHQVNSTNTQYWGQIIDDLRKIYSGKLTYSANWGYSGWYDEKNNIRFWDKLDVIGISAYSPVTDKNHYSIEELASRWDEWNIGAAKLSHKYNKPIIFTEAGYRSLDGNLKNPPQWNSEGLPDEKEQADGYQALLSYWNNKNYMKGLHIWEWESNPNAGGPNDTSFTPQNKLAQKIISEWFGGGQRSGEISAFSATASIDSSLLKTGRETIITIGVKNTGSEISNSIIDLEIFDSKQKNKFQKFFENEVIRPGEAKKYTVAWTPDSVGDYKIKIGIFDPGWSQLKYWKDNALTFKVAGEYP